MKIKKLFIYAAVIALAAAGCKKDNKGIDPGNKGGGDTTQTPPPVTQPKAYAVTENFEAGSKTSYGDGNVTLSTGQWDFNDALIGNLSGDVKDGNWAVRLRTGSLGMLFDVNGVTQIKISHAKYGSDGTSTWQLMISTDGGATYTQLGTDITETSTTLVADSFKVTGAAKARFRIQKTGGNRINIDDIVFSGTGDPGIVTAPPDTDPGDTGGSSNPTGARGVTVGNDAPPATGDNSNMLMGNPSGAQASIAMVDNYLIDQGYYVESYNSTRAEPNWVSWHLDATNTTHVTGRLDNFAAFAGLPSGFYAVQSNSYSGSGFDRGHNCPSADRTSSADANSATFLMTNMIPQAPQNNQQTWANLENYLREETVEGKEVYIIMGSYGSGGTGSNGTATTINGGKVTVPANIWKVAVILPVGNGDISRVSSSTRVIAVNTPNDNTVNSDWTKYITTVRAIEQATGYNLLSALPQNVQDAIENIKDPGK